MVTITRQAMVKKTKHGPKDYEQLRVTLPAQLARALGWKAGDKLNPTIHRNRISFEKVKP